MKLILALLLCTSNWLYSQTIDAKYIKAYNYIDSLEKEKINVSPVIRYLSISSFSRQDEVKNSHLISPDLLNKNSFYNNHYFQPYIDSSISQVFKFENRTDKYLMFSKPIGNILLLEIRRGPIKLSNLNGPYMGIASEYLLIFDNENNVIKCFTEKIIYN